VQANNLDESKSLLALHLLWFNTLVRISAKQKRGNGVNINETIASNSFQIVVCTRDACYGVRLVQLAFEFNPVEAKLDKLISDKTYDSNDLEGEICKWGINMVGLHNIYRWKYPT
jgi:hypothetical protein